ncbi:MAG: cyclase [Pseudonocardiales bacterium]|nr:cyclase [Pseudonocardiales bacterium]
MSAGSGMPEPYLHDLGNGFHLYVQLDGSWGLNNVGIHVGREAVTLIDTTMTERRARALRRAVAELTDKPIRTVINTHHHADHTYGNYLFPEATIIGHELCRSATLATGFATKEWFPGVDWGDLEIRAPEVTFTEELTVWFDDVPGKLRYWGPAHTTDDVTLWIEDRGLLFTGDLAFNGGTPFVVMGSVQGLIDTLVQVDRLGAAVVAPGHGAVCGPETIGDQLRYLRFLQDRAKEGFAAGIAPLDWGRQIDLGEFAGLTDRERLVGNLHRAYSELRGEPLGVALDFDRVVADMVAFNDGHPLHCVA